MRRSSGFGMSSTEALSCGCVDERVGSLSRDTEHAGYVGDGQTVVRMRDGFDDAPRRVGANDLLAVDAASVGDRFGRRRDFAAKVERGIAPGCEGGQFGGGHRDCLRGSVDALGRGTLGRWDVRMQSVPPAFVRSTDESGRIVRKRDDQCLNVDYPDDRLEEAMRVWVRSPEIVAQKSRSAGSLAPIVREHDDRREAVDHPDDRAGDLCARTLRATRRRTRERRGRTRTRTARGRASLLERLQSNDRPVRLPAAIPNFGREIHEPVRGPDLDIAETQAHLLEQHLAALGLAGVAEADALDVLAAQRADDQVVLPLRERGRRCTTPCRPG